MAVKSASPRADAIHQARTHPIRRAILVELGAEEELSASKLTRKLAADEHRVTVPQVSYHLKRLAELGCAELVRDVTVTGANTVEHLYRATEAVSVATLRDGFALDAIADRLESAEGNPYAELKAIAEIVSSTGRPVAVAGAV
jgi:DNA-binding transcriptional ArsR family regulator